MSTGGLVVGLILGLVIMLILCGLLFIPSFNELAYCKELFMSNPGIVVWGSGAVPACLVKVDISGFTTRVNVYEYKELRRKIDENNKNTR